MPDRRASQNVSASVVASGLARPPAAFFARPAVVVARALLGCYVVRCEGDVVMSGRIIETEAYVGPHDAASHAFEGRRTPRNEQMYAPPGTAYIYFTYGMHFCCNVSVVRAGYPAAVLLRALEPVEGAAHMAARRACAVTPPEHKLLSGPGNLCKGLGLDKAFDGENLLTSSRFYITTGGKPLPWPASQVAKTPRVGIGDRGEWTDEPLRFLIRANPSVSGPKPAVRVKRGS